MCGIAGILFPKSDDSFNILDSMLRSIAHRGPDNQGIWNSPEKKCFLGHRRLSILDTSSLGNQPMISKNGRYIIVYNGEIYNFQEIKNELEKEGCVFETNSDTKVLLAAFEIFGFSKTLEKINGMYAFALYDNDKKTTYLVRDRFGEKPLYYTNLNEEFIFASELRALILYPNLPLDISKEATTLFLRFGYIPAPFSIYDNIYKLESASYLMIDASGRTSKHVYWDAEEVANYSLNNPFERNFPHILNNLESILTKSVSQKKISDVPVGCFLSGGIDSSLVAALMQKESSVPIDTFTIGNFVEDYNEAEHAKKISQYLGTNHTELYVGEKEYLDIVPHITQIYDEPFADSSQIPTYLISRIAKNNITVCLTGDGGDELFAGYNRHVLAENIYNKTKKLPNFLKKIATYSFENLNKNLFETEFIKKILPQKYKGNLISQKIHKVVETLNFSDSHESFYIHLTSLIRSNRILKSGELNYDAVKLPSTEFLEKHGFTNWMMLADTITYLPGDILTKVDRASMHVSLETRAPFLDKEVFECAWKIPLGLKKNGVHGKWILKDLLKKFLPEDLFNKPKSGFSIPLAHWIRGPLKEWIIEILSFENIAKYDIANWDYVSEILKHHFNQKFDYSYQIWNLVILHDWLEKNGIQKGKLNV